jgi:hypothetical protein
VPQRTSKTRIELKPTQERVLAALAGDGSGRLTRGRYEDIAGVSRSQAAYDLAELVDAGILERVGGGRATTYRLVRRGRPPGQRHWTNERIHAALVDFCAGRESWPSASEFKADGRSDLYVAASRYGGIGFWATKLGFAQPSRTTPAPQPVVRSWRPRLRWAAGGAAFAAALLAAAGTAVYLGRDAPTHGAAAPPPASSASSVRQSAPAGSKPNVGSRTAATKGRPASQARQHTRASSPSTGSGSTTSRDQAELAVARVSTQTHSVATPRQEVAQRTTGSGSAGPAPLPPPAGSGTAPAPLPPPQR